MHLIPLEVEYSVETISGYLDKNLTDNIKRVQGVGDVTFISETAKLPFASGWILRNSAANRMSRLK